jgi:hypothetical protein
VDAAWASLTAAAQSSDAIVRPAGAVEINDDARRDR